VDVGCHIQAEGSGSTQYVDRMIESRIEQINKDRLAP
jgi:hypothetical protein